MYSPRNFNFRPAAIFEFPVAWAFWTLSILVLMDLRGIFPPEDKNDLVVVAFQLLCCIVVICLARARLGQALGTPGILIVCAFLSYLFIGLVVLIFIGTEMQVDMNRAIRGNLFFIPVLIAAACGCRETIERMETDKFLRMLLVIMTIVCVVILSTPIWRGLGYLPYNIYSPRITGLHQSPNDTGFIGCFTAILALSILLNSRHRALGYVALTAGALVTVGSLSRTAIIVLIAITLFYLIVDNRRGRKAIISWMIATTILVALILVSGEFLSNIVLNFVSQARVSESVMFLFQVQANLADKSLQQRELLWKIGLRMALDSPLFGNGLHQLEHIGGAPLGKANTRLGVHNTYILLIGEAGFIPLTLYILYFASLVRLWFAPKSIARDAVFGWAILFCLLSLVSDHLFSLWAYGLLSGITCSIAATISVRRPETARRSTAQV